MIASTVGDDHLHFADVSRRLVTYYEPENAPIFGDLDRLGAQHLTVEQMATFLEREPYVFEVSTEDEVRTRARTLL